MCGRPEVTAVVVNWNAGDHLGHCLEALVAQSEDVDLDVVVVDNASSDDSLQAADRFGSAVRVIQTGENLGFGRAANRGIAATCRPFVAVLNPDVSLRPGALRRMVDFLAHEETAGLVGPRLLNTEGRVMASCGKPPNLSGEVCRKFLLHLVFPFLNFRRQRHRRRAEVGWVAGACFVARRTALEAVGGMDEAIFMYYEDVDLCLRLRQAGWRVFYLPEAQGGHIGGGSSGQVLGRMLVESETSYDYFARKHLGNAAAALLRALRPLEMGLRSLLWGSLFLVAPGRRQEARVRLGAYRRIFSLGARAQASFDLPGDPLGTALK